jgi:hypothetical protein
MKARHVKIIDSLPLSLLPKVFSVRGWDSNIIFKWRELDTQVQREHKQYITFYVPESYMYLSDFCRFLLCTWAQMALASLVPFQGQKKVSIFGPPPPLKCPLLWVVPPQNHFVPPRINNRYIKSESQKSCDTFALGTFCTSDWISYSLYC